MKDDYIRRQDVVDTINTNADGLEQNGGIPYAQGARAMAIVVEQMPPADIGRRKDMKLISAAVCSISFFVIGYLVGYERCKKIMQKIYHKMTDEEVAKYKKLIFGE